MKILIIGHLPVATQNNMGITFLSLFSRFQRQELCQLYIYPAYPDVDRCASFYRVTDKEVFSSFFRFRAPGQPVPPEKITSSQGLYEVAEDESFYRNRKNKSAVRRLLRDAMWSASRWYSPALKQWLDEQAPDCIFVAPGVAKFLYNMALKISKKRNIPIITYLCDEYYFVNTPDSALDRLRLGLLQKKIRCLMDRSEHLVVICEELRKAYGEEFCKDVTILMTGTATPVADHPESRPQPTTVSYFGNIRCNRYLSLAQVGKTLEQINKEQGTDYRLRVYTPEKDPQFLDVLRQLPTVELPGFVTGDAFREAFDKAELLLHVEAFDEASIDYVRHSVSTKIADSLGSGKVLLAYGPEAVSSMKHLERQDCALIARDPQELKGMLLTAFTDQTARDRAVNRALETARMFHNSDENSRRLRGILQKIITDKK